MTRAEKRDIVLGYCRKHKDMPNTDLARLICTDYPDEFSSVESTRTVVRLYRGKQGALARLEVITDDCFGDGKTADLANPNRKFHPKILIFDIETTPNLAYVWRTFKECVSPAQMIEHSQVLCYAAKWLGNKHMYSDSKQKDKDDKRVCGTLWKLFDEADIVVAHNGQAFDVKCMNARWVFHGYNPPSPYKQVDTLKLAKGVFRFQINKLDYLARYLGIGRKTEHEGFDMWVKCMKGDKTAWAHMIKYNKNDVLLLEEVYLRLRSWDKKHPNVGLMYEDGSDSLRCLVCGSEDVKTIAKSSYTSGREYPSYRCNNCGKVMRGGKADKKRLLLNNVM